MLPHDYIQLVENKINDAYEEGGSNTYESNKQSYEEWLKCILPNQDVFEYTMTGFARSLNLSLSDKYVRFFVNSSGSNVKTMLTNMLDTAVGADYVSIVGPQMFVGNKNKSNSCASPDIMDLKGKRICIVKEASRDMKIHAGIIKWLCGGDGKKIAGRKLYGDQQSFRLDCQLYFCVNLMPEFASADGDGGLKRRVKKVPFQSLFTHDESRVNHDENVYLAKSLGDTPLDKYAELIILDLLERANIPLIEPDVVKIETEEHHDEENHTDAFIDNRSKGKPVSVGC